MTWKIDHTEDFIWDEFTRPCLNFNGDKTKMPFVLGMYEKLHPIVFVDLIPCPCPNPARALAICRWGPKIISDYLHSDAHVFFLTHFGHMTFRCVGDLQHNTFRQWIVVHVPPWTVLYLLYLTDHDQKQSGFTSHHTARSVWHQNISKY